MSSNRTVFVTWKHPEKHIWIPVAQLEEVVTEEGGTFYELTYTKGAWRSWSFFQGLTLPLRNQEQLKEKLRFRELPPFFANRILSQSRAEYTKYLDWIGLDKDSLSPLDILSITRGVRETDDFEIISTQKQIQMIGDEKQQFLVHGLRYATESTLSRIENLAVGEQLFLSLDVQNKYDGSAILLRTKDLVDIGYIPRYFAQSLKSLLQNTPDKVIARVCQVNKDAPLNLRLLCDLILPSDFCITCGNSDFELLQN